MCVPVLELDPGYVPAQKAMASLLIAGERWQQLVEIEPPDFGQGRGGGLNGPLPQMFIGSTDIWLQVRLYSYGPDADRGGIYCNTAQMFRYDPRQTTNTFELMVDLED